MSSNIQSSYFCQQYHVAANDISMAYHHSLKCIPLRSYNILQRLSSLLERHPSTNPLQLLSQPSIYNL